MNKKVLIIVLMAVSIIPQLIFAEIDTLWARKYSAGEYTKFMGCGEIANGRYLAIGSRFDISWDLYLIITDVYGQPILDKIYGGAGPDLGFSLLLADSNRFIIGGQESSAEGSNFDFWLLEINEIGDTIWNKIYSDSSSDEGVRCVRQTADGGYIMVGLLYKGGTDYDMAMAKADSGGNLKWFRSYGDEGNDSGHSVVQTDDGGYLVVGYGDYASMLLVDSLGNEITHINDGKEYYSVTKSIDGDYVAAGAKWHSYGEYYTLYIAKVDSELNLLDWKEYGAFGDWSIGYSIDNTIDGGYIIGGETGPALFYEDGYVLKVDADLEKQWDMTFDVPSTQVEIFSIKETSDSGYIAAGMNGNYAWLLKLGEVQDAVPDDSTNIPNNYITLTSYPNPFNSTTEIKYYLPTNQNITLDIYDLLGRKVETLYDGRQPAGNHIVIWDASGFSSGIYFCRLFSGEKSLIKKMVLLK